MKRFEIGDRVVTVAPNARGEWTHIAEGSIHRVKDFEEVNERQWLQLESCPGLGAYFLAERFELWEPGVDRESEVVHPNHYQNSLGVEVIDIINEYFRDNYCLGNVLKYLLRADKKGNRQQDLEKALQYLTWEVEHGRGIEG